MKVEKSILSILIFISILFSLQTNLSSCQKETLTDTLYIKDTILIRDSILIKDTVRIIDSANCLCYNLNDGLVAYYNFNNGTLQDSSGNGNNIVFNNAVKTTDRFGRPNNAYLFNGTSSYMKVPNSTSLNPKGQITLMGIVKMNGFYSGLCNSNQIFQKGTVDQEQGVYSLRVAFVGSDCYANVDTSKEVAFSFYGDYGYSAGIVDNSNFIRTNTWMTIIFTYDGQMSKLYLNGQLIKTASGSAVFNPNSKDLYIGRAESSLYPYWWNGVIDEIRIYNKALCEGAVKQLSSLNN